MDATPTLTIEELEQRIRRIRSLSGCFRVVRMIEEQSIDALQSQDKIALLTQLLERIKELSQLDPEEIRGYIDNEQKALIRNYTVILLERVGQQNINGIELEQAERDGRKAVRLARTIGNEELEAGALNHLGNTLMITRHIQEAQQHFRASADLDRKHNAGEQLARSLYNLARANLSLGAVHEALDAVNEGLALYEQHASLPAFGQAFFLGVRQDIYENLDEKGKALADSLRSLALFQQLEMTDRLVAAHYHLVHRYISLDQPTEAMHHAMQTADLASRTGIPVDRILSTLALSTIYIRLDQLERAMEYAQEALHQARAIHLGPMEVLALERIARILGRQNQQQTALQYLYEALGKEDRPMAQADLRRIIALMLLELGETEKAHEEIQKRLESDSQRNEKKFDGEFLLVHAAVAAKQKKYEEAIKILDSIISKENIRPTFYKEAHQALADIYQATGNLQKALEHFRHHHALAIEVEQRLAEHRLIALRAQHEVEGHRLEAKKAQELQQTISQEKEQLALEVSERQQIIEQTRHEVSDVVRSLEQNHVEEGKNLLLQILQKLQRMPAAEEQWLRHLPNIDNDFLARLRRTYPGLTSGQIRLCGMLRSGLSSSDIAQHLHLSIETILTQRKRLRKRMNLKEGENLEQLLAEL